MQADNPLCQLCLTEATCSTEAFDFGLLFTFNPATGREGGATVRNLDDNLRQERLKDQWRDHYQSSLVLGSVTECTAEVL